MIEIMDKMIKKKLALFYKIRIYKIGGLRNQDV
jgi:hypothetical protein